MTDAPATSAAVIDGVDVDAVAAAVSACPGVSGLVGGRGDAIASYLPGRRVPGVEVSRAVVVITVRSRWDATAPVLLEQISHAVAPLLHGKHIEVVVADIDDPTDPAAPTATPALLTAAPVSSIRPPPPPVMPTPLPARLATPIPGPAGPSTPAVRLPGSSPASSAPTPAPSPPHFPTV